MTTLTQDQKVAIAKVEDDPDLRAPVKPCRMCLRDDCQGGCI